MIIRKRKISFLINDKDVLSTNWFKKKYLRWEPFTFDVLDYFSDKGKIYLDFGSWIGATVLYASKLYEKVYAFEPDNIAYKKLIANIKQNLNFKNIITINYGIGFESGVSLFGVIGGKNAMGNSYSTMLISENCYLKYYKNEFEKSLHKKYKKEIENGLYLTKINTLSINDFINQYLIDLNFIALIKMDIEGGEVMVVPSMKDFLNKSKVPFLLSLHWDYLKKENIKKILDILFCIYSYAYKNYFIKITKNEILNEKIDNIIFTEIKINQYIRYIIKFFYTKIIFIKKRSKDFIKLFFKSKIIFYILKLKKKINKYIIKNKNKFILNK